MKSNWKRRGSAETVREAIEANAGICADDLTNPDPVHPESLTDLAKAARIIKESVENGEKITVFGDYDADGVTSSAILDAVLREMGAVPNVILPKRLSEGYGLSAKAMKRVAPDTGLLITVDNGISSRDPIRYLKSRGMKVVIIDHHLPPRGSLPQADAIVDPHVYGPSEYKGHCGAGLSYKLAQLLFETGCTGLSDMLENELAALAAIGTIADVCPLTGDNRLIVRKGLSALNRMRACSLTGENIVSLTEKLGLGMSEITEEDTAFKIAPTLNAAGRLTDDGADIAFASLTGEDAGKHADAIIAANEERKRATAETFEAVKIIIEDQGMSRDVPLVVTLDGVREGIVGIIAGKAAELYKTPAIVLTKSGDVFKGSGRSCGGVDLAKALEYASDTILKFGGHKGAAGLTVAKKSLGEMKAMLRDAMSGYVPPSDDLFYDLETSEKDIPAVCDELLKYAPFGEGNPKPVFLVRDVLLSPRRGSHYKLMGDGSHLKMHGNGFDAVAFGKAGAFLVIGAPRKVSLVGSMGRRSFGGTSTFQVETLDFCDAGTDRKQSSLAELMRSASKAV
jgi:single-stranded-DNA-specific exonuclease